MRQRPDDTVPSTEVPELLSSGCPAAPLSSCFASFIELNPTSGSLPSTTPMSPSAISTQNLVMSSSGVGGDASVTLTLADTQGVLSGGLDTVTLNITSQVSVLAKELWDLVKGGCRNVIELSFAK